ncbi:PDC sensor domain-containing protein [Helicobacter cappadocius]|uniref:PDC sensor domain-containing protein n=1 Tax=Helicobacter cappadocius TaxID=3063998 RepID=A0AA90PI53_9HELI|nr:MULTISPECIES: PDC sensor domain-containing protein [unclassified Helicobacter]MDO7252379.1 PDC sensor domain-containing protein [Helicobacter sp. faydin-H75]MDP2538246.1 PDC sensor domain-containing protein [Helicobacter sp. faydin-H76]
MLSKDIVTYSRIRYELRAYICYLFTQNIKNYMPGTSLDSIIYAAKKIQNEIHAFDCIYILDSKGNQIGENISYNQNFHHDEGENFSDKAYYYEAIKEQKCIITNPYPTRFDGKLVVTSSYPVYNDNRELLFIVCIDIPLQEAINISSPSRFYDIFANFSIVMYFCLSTMLTLISILLFIKGIASFWTATVHFRSFDIKEVFESTILLTLSLAIFDLVKAIFEEEVLGKNSGDNHRAIHKTMIRFLGSIVIALAIEALMLVFKFTISEPDKIIYAVYLTGAVSMLLLGLSVYVKFAYGAMDRDERRN